MVRRLVWLSAVIVSLTLCPSLPRGAVVVNEVLANEPGSETTLEWVELYNDGQTAANLQLYPLVIGGSSVVLTDTIAPDSYLIICRQLFGTPSARGFESVWGNNSGVWGDTSTENYPEPIDVSYSLRNDNDTVMLIRAGLDTSVLIWTTEGKDGSSWERVNSGLSEIRQSVDFSGCTPGFVNSVSPVENDLALDNISVTSSESGSEVELTVTNMGFSSAVNRRIVICALNPAMPDSLGELLDSFTVPVLFGGYSTDIVRSIPLAGVYQNLIASLDSDTRLRNNRRPFVGAGAEFPPLVLSELMTRAQAPLATEWIELYCPLMTPFYFQSWSLADNSGSTLISADGATVGAGGYVVLANDTAAFRQFYADFSGILIQPQQWVSLRDDGDTIRLLDRFGILADSFRYAKSYDGNFSWARELSNGDGLWGKSVTYGGSPGRENDVVLDPDNQRLTMTIVPRVFSPDGNGYQDVAEIVLEAPQADAYTLKIYDREGRVVRTLIDNAQFIRQTYAWDGFADSGNRLPIGIYLCYFEAVGVQEIKTTVVIAR